jgi:hypothetical protein
MGLNLITSFVLLLYCFRVVGSYAPVLYGNMSEWAKGISLGVLMLMAAFILRAMYWDVTQYIAGDDWLTLKAALGGQEFSSVFNIIAIFACMALLKAKKSLVSAAKEG